MTKLDRDILSFLQINKASIAATHISKGVRTPKFTIRARLRVMKSWGLVKEQGRSQTGASFWVLTKKGDVAREKNT
jgi:DNA-binding IclR family transcriptional regulator